MYSVFVSPFVWNSEKLLTCVIELSCKISCVVKLRLEKRIENINDRSDLHCHHNQNYFVDKIILESRKAKIIMNSVNTTKSQVSVIGLASIGGKKKSQVE